MSKKEKFFDSTMIKFLIVGAINTLVGSGAMFLLYNLAHLEKWVCVAANYLIGGVVSFFLNKYFTFQNRERSWAQVGRFALTVAACALIGYGAAEPLARFALRNFSVTVQENVSMWWAWSSTQSSTTLPRGSLRFARPSQGMAIVAKT